MTAPGYRQALWLYRRVIEETGGGGGLRDEGLLRAALARPPATFGGKDLYPSIFEKAAALTESLARSHPFVDGNKRMALACARTLLSVNGYQIIASQDAKVALIHRVVAREVTVQEVADWLEHHSQRLA